ncbi:MAG: hypothetical protein AB2A00_32590, partial [Myxococcota bacterium]
MTSAALALCALLAATTGDDVTSCAPTCEPCRAGEGCVEKCTLPPDCPGRCQVTRECASGYVWDDETCACVAGESCGENTCGVDEYCCNESCGICAPEGG